MRICAVAAALDRPEWAMATTLMFADAPLGIEASTASGKTSSVSVTLSDHAASMPMLGTLSSTEYSRTPAHESTKPLQFALSAVSL